ncbi:MFS transporter [Streptomyces geranii]|uniref:MFS transporter n=1 Tax=Streptomyces geranii TaxID=2058923 RepID=UPI000D03171F|nr:MFS transporter [Streptomyces geranii]
MNEASASGDSARTSVGVALLPTLLALEFFAGVIQGWIGPLLGEIGSHYGITGGDLGWVIAVGLLSSAVSVPLMTNLADRFGPRRLLVVAASLTAAGSLLIAVAPTFTFLIVGSVVQGPMAAMLPIEMSLLKRHRPDTANRAVGVLVGALTLGVALGALTSGYLMEAVDDLVVTQLIGAAPLVVMTVVVGLVVPATAGDPGRAVDWAGAGTLGVALIGVMSGLAAGTNVGWTSPSTLAPLVVGVALLLLFLVVENRARMPLFDVKVLRQARLGVPLLLGALVSMPLFGSVTPTVLYLGADPAESGYGAGVSTGAIGGVFAFTVSFLTAGTLVAPLVVRWLGVRLAVCLACLVPVVGLAVLATGPSGTLVVAALFSLNSLGTGIALAVLPGVVIDRAPQSAPASVSGLYNTGRTLGGSLAGALVATIMATLVTATGGTPLHAFQVIWYVFAGILVAAALLALLLGSPRPRDTSAPTAEPARIGAL